MNLNTFLPPEEEHLQASLLLLTGGIMGKLLANPTLIMKAPKEQNGVCLHLFVCTWHERTHRKQRFRSQASESVMHSGIIEKKML